MPRQLLGIIDLDELTSMFINKGKGLVCLNEPHATTTMPLRCLIAMLIALL